MAEPMRGKANSGPFLRKVRNVGLAVLIIYFLIKGGMKFQKKMKAAEAAENKE